MPAEAAQKAACACCAKEFVPGVTGAAGHCSRCYGALRRGSVPSPVSRSEIGKLTRVVGYVSAEAAGALAKRAKRDKLPVSAVISEAIALYLRDS